MIANPIAVDDRRRLRYPSPRDFIGSTCSFSSPHGFGAVGLQLSQIGCTALGETAATKRAESKVRKPRTDAQRNRERILEVVKQAFSQSGASASLDEIAKEAGVGPGLLYRHFPTREDLLEAVYRTEVEKLAGAERKFAETLAPVEALRAGDCTNAF